MSDFIFPVYFLILIRIASFLNTGIFFSIKGTPNLTKIGFSVIFSYIIYLVMPEIAIVNQSIIGYSLQVITEAMYGMVLGYTTYLIFITIQMAGQLVDIQIGFTIGAVYDPITKNKVSIFGKIYYWVGLALFLAVDAHHFILLTIIKSYQILPVGNNGLGSFKSLGFMSVFTDSLKIAFQIAIPIMMILYLTDIIMGMLARTVPQINVFILGMPLKVIVGLVVLIILIPAIGNLIIDAIETLPYSLDKIIRSLSLVR